MNTIFRLFHRKTNLNDTVVKRRIFTRSGVRTHADKQKGYVNENIGHLCNISDGYTYKAETNRVSLSFAYVSRALCQVLTGILFQF